MGETWSVTLTGLPAFSYVAVRDDSLANVAKGLAALINAAPAAVGYVASVEGNRLVIVKTTAGAFTAAMATPVITPASGSNAELAATGTAPSAATAILAGAPLAASAGASR